MTAAASRSGSLRVLMVTPRFLPHIGGVERYVLMLSAALVERGVDVTVATTDPSRSLPSLEHVSGVEVVRVAAWPKRRDYYFAPGIAKVVGAGRWHVVHVQSYHTLVAPHAMLAARRARIPYALTFHGGGSSSRLRRAIRGPQRALLRPLLATADQLVALAQFEIELYGSTLRLPHDHFTHIPAGADFGRFQRLATPSETEPGLIASVGRLERYKGHHRLIEALPAIVESRPDAHVWIAGSGPTERQLRRIAQRAGVADRVEISVVPADAPQEMAARLGRAALVVLLSDYETQPIAVLEALALARPVLVTRNSGLAELADRGLVSAVPDSSGSLEIAAAVVEQLRDPFIPPQVDLPTWDECAARHHDLYIELARD